MVLAGIRPRRGRLERLWIRIARAVGLGEDTRSRRAEAEANALAERWLADYGDSILRLAYAHVHSLDDAEEILQDTLLRVLRRGLTFESPAQEKSYLLKTAINLSRDRLRYNRLRQTDDLTESLAAAEREDLSFVWEAVKQLPAHVREAIHLFYREGYRTAEIAAILGRRESTVRSDLHRGRARLRTILQEDYDFGEV